MILTLVFAFLIPSSFASGACGGAKVGYWVNPDGSRGGSVATTAKVFAGVTIGPQAQVCGEAIVSGKTHIFGRAKISGKSKIHNATICQASQIAGFDVIDSDYYCQTEDPEPAHPGEAGKKTLLGLDTDRDGVKDDVEIWINDTYSNTESDDKLSERVFAKSLAKEFQTTVKLKDNFESMKVQVEKLRLINDCAGFKFKLNEGNFQKLVTEFYDTKERLVLYLEMSKYFRHTDSPSFKELKGVCQQFSFMEISRNKKSEY